MLWLTGHPRCQFLDEEGSLLRVAHHVHGDGAAALRRPGGCLSLSLSLSLKMAGLVPQALSASFK